MRSYRHIATESAWLHRFLTSLTRGPARAVLVGERVRIERANGDSASDIYLGDVRAITVRQSLFWRRLTLHLTNGIEHSIGGLDEGSAARFRDAALAEASQVHAAAVAEVARRAKELGPRLKRLDEELRQLFSGECYARHDDATKLHKAIEPTLQGCQGLVRTHLEREAREALARLEALEPAAKFETARGRANKLFISNNVPDVQAAARPASLTDEQAQAIATDEDVTLVLAGAGTGKTSVIVGKVAHLVRNQDVAPDEILVLAYNRKAAAEIRERLTGDLFKADVRTFHGFGRRIIGECGVSPTISKLAADELALTRAVDDILKGVLYDPVQSNTVINFLLYNHAPYESAFEFKTPAEYGEYVRSVELRTLNCDLVRSFEELAIANYLTEYGIKFQYEAPYHVPTATWQRRQYTPDFFLPDHEIYIEHFALNEQGYPPPGPEWSKYAEEAKWKRNIHTKHGSTLIETYSWQRSQGVLLPTLRRQLEEAGVEFKRVPRRNLVQQLAGQLISWLARLLAKFLNHVKSSGLTPDKLRDRARRAGEFRRSGSFLDVFEQVYARYQQRLREEDALDFHDLINHAAHLVREGSWQQRYRYVLVDEFQDISAGRMALLQSLKRANMAYFLVGDDWQSIYRFAGSDTRLLHSCGDRLGHVQKRTLTQTFRFADGILEPSTSFVKRNPEQTQRPLRAAGVTKDGGVTVIYDDNPAGGVVRALQDIKSNRGSERRSVLVLGRYRRSLNELPKSGRNWSLRLEFSTVHSAKGREADYVVVLDLKDARLGFPSKVEDEPLMDLILPPMSGKAYPHPEERRLFYVAMTRARIGAYLIADPARPSQFVKELLQESVALREIGEAAPECPRCANGRLLSSRSLKTLRCSTYPRCNHQAPRCPSCNAGYVLVVKNGSKCTNQTCDRPPAVCPRCHFGILLVRDGSRGRFFGCSEYPSEPSCTYTKDLSRSPHAPYPARRR